MNWLGSRRGLLVLSTLALLLFLGRALADVRWELSKQDPSGASMPLTYAGYLVVIAVWIWGLLAAQQGSRAAVITMMVLSGLMLVVVAVLTATVFCPPGCEAFPLAWFWNWTGLVGGLLAILSGFLYLRQMSGARG